MRRAVRALLVEDSEDDAALVLLHLRRAGYDVTFERVDTWPEVERALAAGEWDVVLVDHALPGFDSEDVLRALRARCDDVPCILVSGHIGEEAAVRAMRAGAADYVGKDHLHRLEPALARTLREAQERKARRAAEATVRILESAVRNLREGVLVATGDPASPRVVYVNRSFCAIAGVAHEAALLGEPAATLGAPWNELGGLAALHADPTGGRTLEGTARGRGPDGAEQVVEWRVSPVRGPEGRVTHFVSIHRDVTERVRAEAALRESEARYARAARGASDGLWDWDLVRDEVYFSPRWKAMLGHEDAEIGTDPGAWLDRVHPDDRARVDAELRLHLDGGSPHFESEHRVRHRDGGWRWWLVRGLAVRGEGPRATRIAGSTTDITAHKEVEAQLAHGALHDALTGLPNRVLFCDRLRHALTRVRVPGHLAAVLFVDLDRFKMVNDSLGHATGDRLLVEVARRLEACLRPADTVARMGGDEFAVLLEDVREPDEATRVAVKIRAALAGALELSGREVFPTASVGIAIAATAQDRAADLLRDADTAMYRAKALGKARHVVFDAAMHARAVRLLQLESDLRRAVERHEFRVLYQPVVSLASGRVTGVESLVRWAHPTRGLLLPSEFVPFAEETGLIVDIGEHVLRETLRQMRAWQELLGGRAFSVSVNLSGRQFAVPNLCEQLRAALAAAAVDPASLHVEVTETALVDNPEGAAATLAALRGMAVHVSLDDFGTGYSSLSYLQRFPVDILKIDKSFVDRLAEGDNAIVGTIAALAANLGMETVAEGVETRVQAQRLRRLRCTSAQGYLFSRPVSAAAITAMIRDDRAWPMDSRPR